MEVKFTSWFWFLIRGWGVISILIMREVFSLVCFQINIYFVDTDDRSTSFSHIFPVGTSRKRLVLFSIPMEVVTKIPPWHTRMPNTQRFLSPDTAGHGPHITYANCCLAWRQPIRTTVYPRVLNRQMRQPGSYCLSRTMRARWHGWRLPT
jgi:hypothetical protein